MSAVSDLNIKRLEGVAIWMAPALRDKFDFSDDSHYDKLAELSFKAARAIVKYSDGLQSDALAKDEETAAKNRAMAEKQKAESPVENKEGNV